MVKPIARWRAVRFTLLGENGVLGRSKAVQSNIIAVIVLWKLRPKLALDIAWARV
jgi:hypothetical protein